MREHRYTVDGRQYDVVDNGLSPTGLVLLSVYRVKQNGTRGALIRNGARTTQVANTHRGAKS